MLSLTDIAYNIFWILFYIIFLASTILGIFYMLAKTKRQRFLKNKQYNLTFFHVKVPQQNEFEIDAAEQLFAGVAGLRRSTLEGLLKGQYQVSFEILAKHGQIGFYIVMPDELVEFMEKQINGAYPTAEIDIIDPNEVWDRGHFTAIAELKLKGPAFYPIRTIKEKEGDPLSTLTSVLTKLKKDEVIAIQLVTSPASNWWRAAGNAFIGHVKHGGNPEKKSAPDNSMLEGVEKKIGKSGLDVVVRVVSIAETKHIAESHIMNVVTAFEQYTDVKYNKFKKSRVLFKTKFVNDFIYRNITPLNIYIPILYNTLYSRTSVLNITEMANIFHMPNKNIQTPNILWLIARKASAPSNIPHEGLYLGINQFRGSQRGIYMKEKDRTRHMYIIGQTGTGKSEFMKTLVLQDIAAGKGLALIDPHGSDIDDILEKIPESRIDDVILFDVSDIERPMGLNMLEAETEEEKHMIINSFIALLYKLYDPNRQGIMGPQLERAIRNVMLTAMVDKESTMVDVLRLLIDNKYVETFIPRIQDPLVKRYWTDEMANTSDYHKGEKMGYFVSKFDRFVTERTMRNILGQPKSAFNFNKIMAEKKILLVDLSKGKIGEENSNFIGLLLVPRILAAALSRASLLGKEDFPDFYLYVDEFQNFATPDFATILSEARKYKLNLVVAHQFVAQLTDDIKEAVFGNVGTTCVYRVGPDDAEYLEKQFDPYFTKSDLLNLPIGNAYMRLLVDGHPTTPFSLAVDWDMVNKTKKDPSVAKRIRENSSMKYGTPVNEVEEYINKRAGLNKQGEDSQLLEKRSLIPF